jgi:hypothetical protein
VLLCGTDHDLHARAIEAIIRAAEQEELRLKDLDDARARHRRTKERFLAGLAPRPRSAADLSALIGTGEHVALAEAMAGYA